ncbi:hypothetical protein OIG56_001627 [Salmonella enterica]|nr:hypothetical protein [Salmonella enterica]EBQ1579671.1 hypothetical protein [Salmonella enterica]EJZ5489729.1 hypothetical protein [Salmonella enterica]HBJ5625576.1 hypothetical protein [Salmonella enterica subsp. enterica serovar Hvittingfoss]
MFFAAPIKLTKQQHKSGSFFSGWPVFIKKSEQLPLVEHHHKTTTPDDSSAQSLNAFNTPL